MCDTFVIQGRLAQSGRTTLAKNSDREPNEAQYLTETSAADHAPGSTVRCTYIEVPQVAHTPSTTGPGQLGRWQGIGGCGPPGPLLLIDLPGQPE